MKTKVDRLKSLEGLSLSIVESRNSEALFRFCQENHCIGEGKRSEENGIHKIRFRDKRFFDFDLYGYCANYTPPVIQNTRVYVVEYHYDIVIKSHVNQFTTHPHNNIVTLADLLYGTGSLSIREAIKEIFKKCIVENGNLNELLLIDGKKFSMTVIDHLEDKYYESINKRPFFYSFIENYLDIIDELLDELEGLKQYIERYSDLSFQTFMNVLREHQ